MQKVDSHAVPGGPRALQFEAKPVLVTAVRRLGDRQVAQPPQPFPAPQVRRAVLLVIRLQRIGQQPCLRCLNRQRVVRIRVVLAVTVHMDQIAARVETGQADPLETLHRFRRSATVQRIALLIAQGKLQVAVLMREIDACEMVRGSRSRRRETEPVFVQIATVQFVERQVAADVRTFRGAKISWSVACAGRGRRVVRLGPVWFGFDVKRGCHRERVIRLHDRRADSRDADEIAPRPQIRQLDRLDVSSVVGGLDQMHLRIIEIEPQVAEIVVEPDLDPIAGCPVTSEIEGEPILITVVMDRKVSERSRRSACLD